MWCRVLLSGAVLLCCPQVHGKKVPCDLDNSECLTEGAKRVVAMYVSGQFPDVPSVDPLNTDVIEGKLPTLNYTLTKVTLTGMNSCTPELLRIRGNIADYHIVCKHLILESDYVSEGELHSFTTKGRGHCKVDFYDYAVLFAIEHELISKADKVHLKVTSYSVETQPRGSVHYDVPNLYDGDADKSAAMEKHFNDNWQLADRALSAPFMKFFMKSYMDVITAFNDKYPLESQFYSEA